MLGAGRWAQAGQALGVQLDAQGAREAWRWKCVGARAGRRCRQLGARARGAVGMQACEVGGGRRAGRSAGRAQAQCARGARGRQALGARGACNPFHEHCSSKIFSEKKIF